MNEKWKHFYSLMQDDLNRCRTMELPETERAECCYRVALNYWLKIKEHFLQRVIYVDTEEIEFFREVKPQFTAFIEYYLILNQGLLFIPEKIEDRISYWEEEAKRYQRFYVRNKTFIEYYESGCNSQDMQYFLVRYNEQTIMPQERIYEDHDCRSSHDHVVRGFIANRMYRDFVQEKLVELNATMTK